MDKISVELDKWLDEHPECFILEEFLESQKMSQQFYGMLKERSPRLAAMHDFAMMVLGNRRERGGMTGTLNAGLVDRSQHMYSKRWEEGIEKREEIRAKYAAKAQAAQEQIKYEIVTKKQVVEIPDFETGEK